MLEGGGGEGRRIQEILTIILFSKTTKNLPGRNKKIKNP
jgi:hypothetical protein